MRYTIPLFISLIVGAYALQSHFNIAKDPRDRECMVENRGTHDKCLRGIFKLCNDDGECLHAINGDIKLSKTKCTPIVFTAFSRNGKDYYSRMYPIIDGMRERFVSGHGWFNCDLSYTAKNSPPEIELVEISYINNVIRAKIVATTGPLSGCWGSRSGIGRHKEKMHFKHENYVEFVVTSYNFVKDAMWDCPI
jgi:hypothetical protein